MLPPNQRLYGFSAARGQIHDRLVVKPELVMRDGREQFVLEVEPLARNPVHGFVERIEGALTLTLRLVHCDIGVSQQVGRRLTSFVQRDAHTAIHDHGLTLELKRLCQRLQDTMSRHRDVLDFVQKHCELVASKSRSSVRGSHTLLDSLCHCNQQFVPGRVAETVVDRLEVVEVQERYRDPLAVLPSPAESVLNSILEEGAVGESG